MAKFIVTQKLNYKGKPTSATFELNGTASDVTAFTALLEGGYEVKEVNASLSDSTGIDTVVSSTNMYTNIGLIGPQNQYASIRPYSGAIHFKNTASGDDIAAVCLLMKPFPLLPTELPTKVSFRSNEVRTA